MIFSGDTYVPLPTKELYDTQMMLAAVNAAKDMYDKAKNDYDLFLEKYSDFTSPVYGATDAFNLLTSGRMLNVINNLYAQGIDPLRSSQGRAALQNAIRTTDYGRLNALKQQAKDYEAYLNARREMVAKGLTTDAFEDYMLRKQNLDGFLALDGEGNVNVWSRLTPTQYQTLGELTALNFDHLKPEEYLGVSNKNKYVDVYGISDQYIQGATDASVSGLAGTELGEYYREQAEAKVLAANPGLTGEALQSAVNAQLRLDIIDANKDRLQNKEEFNSSRYTQALENYRARLSASSRGNGDRTTEGGLPTYNFVYDNYEKALMNFAGNTASNYRMSIDNSGVTYGEAAFRGVYQNILKNANNPKYFVSRAIPTAYGTFEEMHGIDKSKAQHGWYTMDDKSQFKSSYQISNLKSTGNKPQKGQWKVGDTEKYVYKPTNQTTLGLVKDHNGKLRYAMYDVVITAPLVNDGLDANGTPKYKPDTNNTRYAFVAVGVATMPIEGGKSEIDPMLSSGALFQSAQVGKNIGTSNTDIEPYYNLSFNNPYIYRR